MQSIISLLLVLFSVSAPYTVLVRAASLSQLDSPCAEACHMTLSKVKFNDAGANVTFKQGVCRNRLAQASFYLCADVYCSIKERTFGLDAQNSTCQASWSAVLPPFDEIRREYTDDDINHLRKISGKDDDSLNLAHSEPVIPSSEFLALAHNTLYTWNYVHGLHITYSYALFVFWAVVIFVAFICRMLPVLSHAHSSRKQQTATYIPLRGAVDGEESPCGKAHPNRSHLLTWLRRFITIPATFGYRSAQAFGWYTVPPRLQSLTILAFILMNTAFCVLGYRFFSGNLYWPTIRAQALRYVSDRTGTISWANFPLIWLFGSRNNVLMWLTGWDFGAASNFHRWIARVATVQAIIHSVGYTLLVFDEGGWGSGGWERFANYWAELWWWTGEIATITMSILLVLSLYWLRRHIYETFLIVHIGFSVLILITMKGHVSIFRGNYDGIFWICCLIWVLDRLLRLIRILALNKTFWNTPAEAIYDSDSNIVRLNVPVRSPLRFFSPNPGTFFYIYILNDARFWESHPFTMAMIKSPSVPSSQLADRYSIDMPTEAATLLPQPDLDSAHDATTETGTLKTPVLTFLIRPYDSFTKRLQEKAKRTGSARVLVEGPYGATHPLHQFDCVLFIIGGSGIVVPLTYLGTLCKESSKVSSIHIIWAVQEAAFATDVLQQDLQQFVAQDKVTVDIHITRDKNVTPSAVIPVTSHAQNVKTYRGRPDVDHAVQLAGEEAGFGSLAVVACGPGRMSDDTRRAVVSTLETCESSIEFFHESFNW